MSKLSNSDPIKVYRGDYLESTHQIHIAVVNNEGDLIYSYGNPTKEIYARSSLKPFQAINILDSGAYETFNFTKRNVAVCCASHSAENIHREEVSSILHKINLNSNVLKCGSHPPRNPEVFKEVIAEDMLDNAVIHNCSGKHVGILASCVATGNDIDTYDEHDHPLQMKIKEALAHVTRLDVAEITEGVDGCNLPTHRLPLTNLAIGYSHLANSKNAPAEYKDTLQIIRDSMIAYPELVAGTDRFDTDLMRAGKGRIVSKMGAEGIQCVGLTESGIGIAIKVDDGNERAASVAILQVLKELNFVDDLFYDTMKKYSRPTLLNASGNEVGYITSDFDLSKN